MELKSQIILAVFTSLGGILVACLTIVFAFCYRRRGRLSRHGGHCRTHETHEEESDKGHTNLESWRNRNRPRGNLKQGNDTVSINLEHRGSGKSNNTFQSNEQIPEQFNKLDENKVELRPKLREQSSKRSIKKERENQNKRRHSDTNAINGGYSDFRRTKSLDMRQIPRPRLWLEEIDEHATRATGRSRDSSEFRTQNERKSSNSQDIESSAKRMSWSHIPRPSVRLYKNELYDDSKSDTYDLITDHETADMSSRRHSSLAFY